MTSSEGKYSVSEEWNFVSGKIKCKKYWLYKTRIIGREIKDIGCLNSNKFLKTWFVT